MDPDPTSSLSVAVLLFADTAYALDPGVFVTELIILLLLLATSAFFSGSEVAMFSIDNATMEDLRSSEEGRNRLVATLLETPRQLLITILILNTVVNVGAAILAAVMTLQIAMHFGLSIPLLLAMEVVVLTFVMLVISELTPKLIATKHSVAYSRIAAPVLRVFYHLFRPISASLARGTMFIQKRLKPTSTRLSSEDLKAMADVGEAQGTLEENERDLIYSIVEFGNTTVREVMVSRLDIVALPVTANFAEALDVIRSNGHSRIPLYKEHLDNILGVLYAKDLLPLIGNHEPERVEWARLARPAMFVPLGKKLDDLLHDFQTRKTHIAIVVDEYGGTAGIVTLEDVLEEIVGDIRDEHDEDETTYEKLAPDTYRFDARIDLDEINELLGLGWNTEEFEFETLGGLIYHLLGYIPAAGEEVAFPPLSLTVQNVETHRIIDVIVRVDPNFVEREVEASRPNGKKAENGQGR